jgi:hypothetical protein
VDNCRRRNWSTNKEIRNTDQAGSDILPAHPAQGEDSGFFKSVASV